MKRGTRKLQVSVKGLLGDVAQNLGWGRTSADKELRDTRRWGEGRRPPEGMSLQRVAVRLNASEKVTDAPRTHVR